jgi:hypothetical protein
VEEHRLYKRWTLDTLDFRVWLTQRSNTRSVASSSKARAYGALEVFNEPSWSPEETRLVLDALRREGAGSLTGKCPVLAAHQRKGVVGARVGLERELPLLMSVLRQSGVDVRLSTSEPLTVKFSKVAGCSCGCSPGFVLNQTVRLDGRAVDIWFDEH